jgi:uncharacterized protein (DUF1810 family)
VTEPDPFDLERFVRAQAPVFEQVRQELRSGRKSSHWMWFVFPQLQGLGHSAMARRYALSGPEEAHAYLHHPLLGARLIECTQLVNRIEGSTIQTVFASPDDLKFHSCMTLFATLPAAPAVFTAALDKYFGGAGDRLTLGAIAGA